MCTLLLDWKLISIICFLVGKYFNIFPVSEYSFFCKLKKRRAWSSGSSLTVRSGPASPQQRTTRETWISLYKVSEKRQGGHNSLTVMCLQTKGTDISISRCSWCKATHRRQNISKPQRQWRDQCEQRCWMVCLIFDVWLKFWGNQRGKEVAQHYNQCMVSAAQILLLCCCNVRN